MLDKALLLVINYIENLMDSICSSSWTLSTATELPNLEGAPGTGLEYGLGKMAVGLAQGVLIGNKADNIEHCIDEVKVLVCDLKDAYNSIADEDNGTMMIKHLMDAGAQFATTKADCIKGVNTDLPELKEWASVLKQPMGDVEKLIAKNVMRHSIRFYENFNIAKKTWDAHSYFWTGERMGEMLVMATARKNILY